MKRQLKTRAILLGAIALYQKTLSPDTGWFSYKHPYGYCRFYPTCSSYAADAIRTKGVVRGVVLGVRRVSRCHPWQKGGYDPVQS